MPLRRWFLAVLLLSAAVLLACFGGNLPLALVVALEVVAGIALAALLRPALQQFFGPVLSCDLIRTTRHGRYFFVRCGYAAALLAVLYLLFRDWATEQRGVGGTLSLSPHEMAEFAYSFFSAFLAAQFGLAMLLTPIYTANAITEEKERRTLEFLLATDLSEREIILSKLASRLAQLTLVLLAGLPILALLQFLGGVDPNLLLLAFAATGLSMLSLASLSLVISVYCRTAWDAVFRTYLAALLLAVASSLLGNLTGLPAYAYGNPFIALAQLQDASDPGAVFGTLLLDFGSFHVLVAAACCLWAVLGLRPAALSEASTAALPPQPETEEPDWAGDIVKPRRQRPPVSDRALLWKELHDEPFGWQGRNPVMDVFALLLAWLVLPFVLILVLFTSEKPLGTELVNGAARVFGTASMTFTFLLTGLNAAGRFSREFERQTLDNLLTVPERDGILFAKWWASVLHMRGLWWFLAWLWIMGIITGGLHVAAVLLLAVAWLVFAGFVAALGVWFSLLTRSTLRATIGTLLTFFGVMLGTWLAAGYVASALQLDHPRLARLMDHFQEWGTVAPWTLWLFSFPFSKVKERAFAAPALSDLLVALLGLAYYATLAGFLWLGAQARFRALTVGKQARPVDAAEAPAPRPIHEKLAN